MHMRVEIIQNSKVWQRETKIAWWVTASKCQFLQPCKTQRPKLRKIETVKADECWCGINKRIPICMMMGMMSSRYPYSLCSGDWPVPVFFGKCADIALHEHLHGF